MSPADYQKLVLQCLAMTVLGMLASYLLSNHGSSVNKSRNTPSHDSGGRSEVVKYQSCREFIRASKLPVGVKLGSKTPYQFATGSIEDESYSEGCQAVQVANWLRAVTVLVQSD